jgi:hypothetical protein
VGNFSSVTTKRWRLRVSDQPLQVLRPTCGDLTFPGDVDRFALCEPFLDAVWVHLAAAYLRIEP